MFKTKVMEGIKDLMEINRYQTKHLAEKLKEEGVPGNWDLKQNIYNWMGGLHRPKDPYVYVVLSRMFNISIEDVILRYSEVDKSPSTEDPNKEVGEIKLTNKYSNW